MFEEDTRLMRHAYVESLVTAVRVEHDFPHSDDLREEALDLALFELARWEVLVRIEIKRILGMA
jgi:hypothetical protein